MPVCVRDGELASKCACAYACACACACACVCVWAFDQTKTQLLIKTHTKYEQQELSSAKPEVLEFILHSKLPSKSRAYKPLSAENIT